MKNSQNQMAPLRLGRSFQRFSARDRMREMVRVVVDELWLNYPQPLALATILRMSVACE